MFRKWQASQELGFVGQVLLIRIGDNTCTKDHMLIPSAVWALLVTWFGNTGGASITAVLWH